MSRLIFMIGNDWDSALKDEFEKDYFSNIEDFVKKEYETKTIFPPFDEIFNAFKLTPLNKVKVVILGQDPYHEKGQAHGLAFSTPSGRTGRQADSKVSEKYFQGNQFGIWISNSRVRMFGIVGKTGCVSAQYGIDGGGRQSQFPQQMRMANIYRQCYKIA